MELISILESSKGNCCMIDDKLLYEGDSIGKFEVVKIKPDLVKLRSDNFEVVLKLQSE